MNETVEIPLQDLTIPERNALIGTARTFSLRERDGEGVLTVSGIVSVIAVMVDDPEDADEKVTLGIKDSNGFTTTGADADIYLVR